MGGGGGGERNSFPESNNIINFMVNYFKVGGLARKKNAIINYPITNFYHQSSGYF